MIGPKKIRFSYRPRQAHSPNNSHLELYDVLWLSTHGDLDNISVNIGPPRTPCCTWLSKIYGSSASLNGGGWKC